MNEWIITQTSTEFMLYNKKRYNSHILHYSANTISELVDGFIKGNREHVFRDHKKPLGNTIISCQFIYKVKNEYPDYFI